MGFAVFVSLLFVAVVWLLYELLVVAVFIVTSVLDAIGKLADRLTKNR